MKFTKNRQFQTVCSKQNCKTNYSTLSALLRAAGSPFLTRARQTVCLVGTPTIQERWQTIVVEAMGVDEVPADEADGELNDASIQDLIDACKRVDWTRNRVPDRATWLDEFKRDFCRSRASGETVEENLLFNVYVCRPENCRCHLPATFLA